MSLNNDYTVQALTRQRHQELMAAAAKDRLARMVPNHRQPWWRRRSGKTPGGRRLVALTPGAQLRSQGQGLGTRSTRRLASWPAGYGRWRRPR